MLQCELCFKAIRPDLKATGRLNKFYRDPLTFAVWSKTSSLLAVGNAKGNLLLYNHQTQRKVPIVGKHTKKITCGAFNDKNLLALGSEDQTITVSNIDGDTLHAFSVDSSPSDIQFADMKESERGEGQMTVSDG